MSLQLGHRESVDIDLFTDAEYGTIDFDSIDKFLRNQFPYVDTSGVEIVGMGRSYFVGNSELHAVKLDLFYSDPFIREIVKMDGIRFASIDDIIAMKIEVIGQGGRKKDFWDLHELLEFYTIDQMLQLHQERYPYNHNGPELLANFTKFEKADNDFDPICLKGKFWELIKLDIMEALDNTII